MNYYSRIVAFLSVVILSFAIPVSANLISCDSTTLAKVQYASACERSTLYTQDYLNTTPITVNDDGGFFGATDWSFLKKDDPIINGQSGTWSLTNNEWSQYANIMLIFKDGSGTTLLGFLLTPTNTSGAWLSPFTAVEFPNLCMGNDCSKIKDVSHISYYVRGTSGGEEPPPVGVMEPAPLYLMLLGLAGLMIVRRRQES
jgi:hypothetical protein